MTKVPHGTKACGGSLVTAAFPGNPRVVLGCIHLEDGVVVGYVEPELRGKAGSAQQRMMVLAIDCAKKELTAGRWPPKPQ